ncbi:MAG TPA: hypothetical protein VGB30_01000 [bacterium]|jgi:hypothetical protein
MQIAYLQAKSVDDQSWSGGLLLTDERGLPMDFRYVEPIRPGKIQKLIYGEALQRYLVLDAIAASLLKAANFEAEWYFTNSEILLELDGDVSGRFIKVQNGERATLQKPGDWEVRGTGHLLFQSSRTGPAVSLNYNAKDEQGTEEIAKDLSWLAEQYDFTEPLNRVDSALREICRGKID